MFLFSSLQFFRCRSFISVLSGYHKKVRHRESLLDEENIRKKSKKKRAASSCWYRTAAAFCCAFDGFRTSRENIQSMAICRAQTTFTHVHREKVISASPVIRLHSLSSTHIHICRSRESEERYQLWWVFFVTFFSFLSQKSNLDFTIADHLNNIFFFFLLTFALFALLNSPAR